MVDLSAAFETAADPMWVQKLAAATGGYLAAVASRATVESRFTTLPDETYGIAVFLLVVSMEDTVPMSGAVEAGALVDAGDQLARRLGIRSTVAGGV